MTMYGIEPLMVEYMLGTDLTVEKLSFLPVSDVFLDDPGYYYLKLFDGEVYFYNNTTRNYDRVNIGQVDFEADELRPYLSSKGSILVKYTINDNEFSGVSSLLPHLMVTGRAN